MNGAWHECPECRAVVPPGTLLEHLDRCHGLDSSAAADYLHARLADLVDGVWRWRPMRPIERTWLELPEFKRTLIIDQLAQFALMNRDLVCDDPSSGCEATAFTNNQRYWFPHALFMDAVDIMLHGYELTRARWNELLDRYFGARMN